MNVAIEQNQLAAYFEEFNRRNRWRATRLLAATKALEFSAKGTMLLVGVSLDADPEGATRIHIMLGVQCARGASNQTFTLSGVRRVSHECGDDGNVNSLEIEDEQGETSQLRFEPMEALISGS